MPHPFGGEPACLHVPDPLIAEAFEHAMHDHVLQCLGPEVFDWYFYICAHNKGRGLDGPVWPGLDGHQMGHALMWAGHIYENLGYWDYVKAEQRQNGQIPYRIETDDSRIPPDGITGPYISFIGRSKFISAFQPGPSLFILAASTWVKEGYDLFRFTQDRDWLERNFESIDRAAVWITSMADVDGLVGCGSYYQDLPTRYEFDGITQGYAYQNYLQTAELAEQLGRDDRAAHFRGEAQRIRKAFANRFWLGERCAEYVHPFNGAIDSHGLSDTDWIAQGVGLVDDDKDKVLWQQLARSEELYYGIMPTGPCAKPENYQWWETTSKYRMHLHNSDSRFFGELAAMGRVWFVESMARHRRLDGAGLVDTLQRVAKVGRHQDWSWSERYYRIDLPPSPAREDQQHHMKLINKHGKIGRAYKLDEFGCYASGHEHYGEWPANLVRICCQWLAGVDLAVDGALTLSPCAPQSYFDDGFGLDATLLGRRVEVRYDAKGMQLKVAPGSPWPLRMRTKPWGHVDPTTVQCSVDGQALSVTQSDGWLGWQLPASDATQQCTCLVK